MRYKNFPMFSRRSTIYSTATTRTPQLYPVPAGTVERYLRRGSIPELHTETAHSETSGHHQGTGQGQYLGRLGNEVLQFK